MTQLARIAAAKVPTLPSVARSGDSRICTVEAIAAAEPEITSPLVTAQNKPRYKYCSTCKEEGRKTIAKYLCIDCSNRYGREVILCEACTPEHDDHYLDEILY